MESFEHFRQMNKYLDYALEGAKSFDDDRPFLEAGSKCFFEMKFGGVDFYFNKRIEEIKEVKFEIGYPYAVLKLERLIDEERFGEVYDLVGDYVERVEDDCFVSGEDKERMVGELRRLECLACWDEFCLETLFDVGLD